MAAGDNQPCGDQEGVLSAKLWRLKLLEAEFACCHFEMAGKKKNLTHNFLLGSKETLVERKISDPQLKRMSTNSQEPPEPPEDGSFWFLVETSKLSARPRASNPPTRHRIF